MGCIELHGEGGKEENGRQIHVAAILSTHKKHDLLHEHLFLYLHVEGCAARRRTRHDNRKKQQEQQ
jgi:hypothetical protein